jgi:hypothetical protein
MDLSDSGIGPLFCSVQYAFSAMRRPNPSALPKLTSESHRRAIAPRSMCSTRSGPYCWASRFSIRAWGRKFSWLPHSSTAKPQRCRHIAHFSAFDSIVPRPLRGAPSGAMGTSRVRSTAVLRVASLTSLLSDRSMVSMTIFSPRLTSLRGAVPIAPRRIARLPRSPHVRRLRSPAASWCPSRCAGARLSPNPPADYTAIFV